MPKAEEAGCISQELDSLVEDSTAKMDIIP